MSLTPTLALIRTLEEKAFRAWPALETLSHAGWVQRFAGGYTKRANSINALEAGTEFGCDLATFLERPYRERGLRPVWRLSPLAPPAADTILAGRGYQRIDESLVQIASIGAHFTADAEVKILPDPSPAWLAGFSELSPVVPEHRAAMSRMLHSIAAPVGFAHVEQGGRLVAFALGVADGGHVGLFDVLVSPLARRQGLARRLTASIGAWGRAQGAHSVYLQVTLANSAARPLYDALGFKTVYSYAYRVPPAP